MEEITARGGLLIDQSLAVLSHKDEWALPRILVDKGVVGKNSRKREHSTCKTVTCVKMNCSEKGEILCMNH